jgi:hypothetical protein
MMAYADVEGIQTMCLKVLPFLLEDEQQQSTAQHAGLTDIVLRDMVYFPDSVQLHTPAFHIIVISTPVATRWTRGILFHTSMVQLSGIPPSARSGTRRGGKNGIAVMLDSMRRFRSADEVLKQ